MIFIAKESSTLLVSKYYW